jgi:hypothetical protein
MVGTYSYDNASQLTGITYKQGSTTVGTLTYGYDNAGRIANRGGTLFQSVLPSAVTSATYNADNRLTNWTTPSGAANPTYDANGNMTNDGTRTYGWDARNRLTFVYGIPSETTYDPAGRRIFGFVGGAAKGWTKACPAPASASPLSATSPSSMADRSRWTTRLWATLKPVSCYR